MKGILIYLKFIAAFLSLLSCSLIWLALFDPGVREISLGIWVVIAYLFIGILFITQLIRFSSTYSRANLIFYAVFYTLTFLLPAIALIIVFELFQTIQC